MTFEELKKHIAELPVGGSGRRKYPRAVKEAALAILEEKRAEGWTQSRLADELGLNQATLSHWRRRALKGNQAVGKIRPVRLVSEAETRGDECASRRAVVLPSGVRVEGLEMTELLALVKVLR